MPAQKVDHQLVHACLRGDQSAWNRLIDQYGRLVYSIARRYGLDEADADDVFQNAFSQLYRSLDRLKEFDKISSWLITTTHRECWRLGKRQAQNVELDERDIRADSPPDHLTHEWERQHVVRQALDELGNPCRPLLEALFYRGGASDYETIASELGMKVGSVGPTRARCFKKMEAILCRLGITDALDEA